MSKSTQRTVTLSDNDWDWVMSAMYLLEKVNSWQDQGINQRQLEEISYSLAVQAKDL